MASLFAVCDRFKFTIQQCLDMPLEHYNTLLYFLIKEGKQYKKDSDLNNAKHGR